MATMNQMMNLGTHEYHGFCLPLSAVNDCRKKKGVTSARMTIHKARVSLTVVATSKALTPCDDTSSGCIWS